MIDRLFTAALAFTLLAGGSAAIGFALFGDEPAVPLAVKRLPTVEVQVDRAATAATRVRLAAGETILRRFVQ